MALLDDQADGRLADARRRREEQRRTLQLRTADAKRIIKNAGRVVKELKKQLPGLERRFAVLEKAARLGHEGSERMRTVVGGELGDLRGKIALHGNMAASAEQALALIGDAMVELSTSAEEATVITDAEAELAAMREG